MKKKKATNITNSGIPISWTPFFWTSQKLEPKVVSAPQSNTVILQLVSQTKPFFEPIFNSFWERNWMRSVLLQRSSWVWHVWCRCTDFLTSAAVTEIFQSPSTGCVERRNSLLTTPNKRFTPSHEFEHFHLHVQLITNNTIGVLKSYVGFGSAYREQWNQGHSCTNLMGC